MTVPTQIYCARYHDPPVEMDLRWDPSQGTGDWVCRSCGEAIPTDVVENCLDDYIHNELVIVRVRSTGSPRVTDRTRAKLPPAP
jgi:hypothetical protein